MTRHRALKQVIRARAARTGERYTTARRHVLSDLEPRPTSVVGRPTAPAQHAVNADETPAVAPRSSAGGRAVSLPKISKGGVSDAKSREKTGHGLDHWFDVLDRFGGVEKGHTASARHLYEAHQVDGWYAQGITVAYERARGVRAVNQRSDGEYEVSVSKVVAARTTDVVKAFTDARLRRRWLDDADTGLAKALSSALDSPAARGIVVRPDGQGRFRYKWGDTTLQLYLLPKPGGKVSIVATNSKLSETTMVEERRAHWRTALNALARLYAPPKA